MSENTLTTDSAARKAIPIMSGVLDYFPAAIAEIARLSKAGNDKHNPGEPLHWSRGKSSDHADCIVRHLLERGTVDPDDGFLHETKAAWRALALLQESLEARGAPLSRGSRPAADPSRGVTVHPPYGPSRPATPAEAEEHFRWLPSDLETRATRRKEADYQERRALDGF